MITTLRRLLVSIVLLTVPAGAQDVQVISGPETSVNPQEARPCVLLTVLNNTSSPVTLEGELVGASGVFPMTYDLPTSATCAAEPAGSATLPAHTARTVRVQADKASLATFLAGASTWTGPLVVRGSATTAATVPVTFEVPARLGATGLQQVFLPLLLAALVIAGVAWNVRRHLGQDMPAAEWTPEKSWGSNLALIAGLISAVGGVVKVADSMSLVVAVTGVIFTLLGTVAPLLYRATLHATPGKPEEQSGSVVGYLFASLITLWSAFGGILTVGLLLRTLARKLGQVEGDSLTAVVVTLAFAIVLAVVLFSWQRLVQNIREQLGATHRQRRSSLL